MTGETAITRAERLFQLLGEADQHGGWWKKKLLAGSRTVQTILYVDVEAPACSKCRKPILFDYGSIISLNQFTVNIKINVF